MPVSHFSAKRSSIVTDWHVPFSISFEDVLIDKCSHQVLVTDHHILNSLFI